MKIRITKIFTFEMAHALKNYDGPCKNIHGHSYTLEVTVSGTPDQNYDSSKFGMVMDFGVLKQIVRNTIVDKFDHALVVHEDDKSTISSFLQDDQNIIFTKYQPTSENMIISFVDEIKKFLPEGVVLERILLRETATSYAEWLRSDH